ncbi:MAG: hypothetical protein A2033_14395 [Bacteroidetes bacterium GWA2_31_9]|nr:MAG: hypothetical protein A2033_14395 [Bacteroidetes bacterium GWA2_31_9]
MTIRNVIKFLGLVLITITLHATPDTLRLQNIDTICDKFYYETGELYAKGCIVKKNDTEIKQGIWIYYHKNGIVSDSIEYHNDKIIGKSISFYPNGEIVQIANYNDESVQIKYFLKNRKSYFGKYTNINHRMIPTGWFVHFYRNNAISDSVLYENGEEIFSKHFYITGQLFVETKYSSDRKKRERCVYKKNGAVRDCDSEIYTKNTRGFEMWVDTNPDPMNMWTIILPIALSMIIAALL